MWGGPGGFEAVAAGWPGTGAGEEPGSSEAGLLLRCIGGLRPWDLAWCWGKSKSWMCGGSLALGTRGVWLCARGYSSCMGPLESGWYEGGLALRFSVSLGIT